MSNDKKENINEGKIPPRKPPRKNPDTDKDGGKLPPRKPKPNPNKDKK